MWRKLGRIYPLRLELVPLAVLALGIYIVLSNWGMLPEKVPSHFGIDGAPNAWGAKNNLYHFPVLGLVYYLLFTGITVWSALARDPRKLINLPPARKARITEAQAEDLRVFMGRILFGMKTLVMGLNTYTAYISIEIAMGRSGGLSWLWFLFLVGILILAGIILWKVLRLTFTS